MAGSGTNSELRNPLDNILPPFDPFPIDPSDTALLSIDLQYLDAHRDWGFGKTAREQGEGARFEAFFRRVETVVLPAVSRLQQVFRDQAFLVMHAHIAAQTYDCRDMSPGFKMRKILAPLGSKEAEILPEVQPRPGEIVFAKVGASPFNSTGIDMRLRNLGVRHLILVGVVTNGCVELTARDAADRGYRITLVEEGCAAMTDRLHEDAMERVVTAMIQRATISEVISRVGVGDEVVGAHRV
jgi:nicotinamidase-related amidase